MEKWKLKCIFCSASWNAEMYFLKPCTASQLKRTGNQSLYTFACQCPWLWRFRTLQRRKWLFPIPHPLPRPLVPISLVEAIKYGHTGSVLHNSKGAIFHQLRVNCSPWSCAVLLLEQSLPTALYWGWHLQSHELLAELQLLVCPWPLQQCLVQSRTLI